MRSCWKSSLIWASQMDGKTTSPAYCSASGRVTVGEAVCTENLLGMCLSVPNMWHLLQLVCLLILALSLFGCVAWGRLLKLSESHFPHLLNEVIIVNAKDNARSRSRLSLDDAFFAVML